MPSPRAIGSLLPRLCRAIRAATGADGLNVIVNNGRAAGQTIDHCHWHIIPRFDDDRSTGPGRTAIRRRRAGPDEIPHRARVESSIAPGPDRELIRVAASLASRLGRCIIMSCTRQQCRSVERNARRLSRPSTRQTLEGNQCRSPDLHRVRKILPPQGRDGGPKVRCPECETILVVPAARAEEVAVRAGHG